MEAIEARATLKFTRISPQKTRLVANLIRGVKADQAIRILSFTNKRSARVLLKILKSAIANAEVKNVEDTELLDVSGIWVNQGPVQRRYQPRARGRADVIRHPTSHITIIVKEDLKAKQEAAARLAEMEARKAKKRTEKKKAAVKKGKAGEPESKKTGKKEAVPKKEAKEKEPAAKSESKNKAKARQSKPKKEK